MDKPTGREVRIATEAWPLEEMEIRAESDGMTFKGYAARFGVWSEDLGGFRERIKAGAFAKSLADKRAIKMFWNHNTDIPLGSTRGSLTLTEDEKGLLAEARLPDTQAGRDMSQLIREKIVDSMSFGFEAIKRYQSEERDDGQELVEAKLWEISPVTAWPAYPQTSASVRELAAEIKAEPDILAEAFRALRATDELISDEQHDLLTALLNARSTRQLVRMKPVPVWYEELERKALATV